MSSDIQVPTPMLQPVPEPIPEGYFQRWKLFVDGKEAQARHITLVNEEQSLQLDWGSHPDGKWSQFMYREAHGGGVVSVPYAVNRDGVVYIGVVDARRPFRDPRQNASVMELPRGMRGKLETATQAAQRETEEETGHTASEGSYFELEGDGVNPNSTFWVTFDNTIGAPDGVRFVATEVPIELLVPSSNDKLVFATSATLDAFEGIKACSFVPFNIRDLAGEGDMFLHSGVLRLQSYLATKYDHVSFKEGVMVVSD